MSSPGIHVLANGFFGSGNLPLNHRTGGDRAVDYWASTDRSSAEVGGILALIYDAYFDETGSYPTWQTARALLMNSARTTFNDPLAQGAGLANAYNAVEIIRGSRGVLVTNSEEDGYWLPGSYRGAEYEGFARGLFQGESDTEQFTVNNFSATDPVTVTLETVTMERIDHREWNVTSLDLATEGGQGTYGRRLFGPTGSNPGYGADDPFYVAGVDDALLADADLMIVRLAYPYEQFLDDAANNGWSLYATAWRDVDVVDGSWFTDTNANGYFNSGEEQDETVRISYDGPGNSAEIRIREPWNLMHGNSIVAPNEPPMAPMDDIVIMLRHLTYGGYDTTDLAVTVDLYQEAPWTGLELPTSSLTVTAASSETFSVTARTVIPLSTLLFEGFEGSFPPTGWQVVTNTVGGQWDRNDALGQSGYDLTYGSGFFAASGSDGNVNTAWDTALWSPAIDLLDVSETVLLQYASNFQDYAGNGAAYLDVSTNGGTDWINLYSQTNDDSGGTGGGGVLREVDLSDYAGQTIHLRWRYVADSGPDWFWQIDDVHVFEAQVLPPGEYAGYVKLSTTEPYTYAQYLPVQQQVWFSSQGNTVLGGVDQPGLYDNGVLFGGTGPSSVGQRAESGDWRFFYTDVIDPPDGSYLLAHTTWVGEGDAPNDTDIDTIFYAPDPTDPLFSGHGSIFGPSGLTVAGGSLRAGSGPDWDYSTSTGGPDDWSSIPLTSDGLHGVAAQVVRWGGEQTEVPFTITVGTVEATSEVVLSGLTCVSCTVPLSFKTNHADLEGLPLEAVSYGFTQPVSETIPVTQSASSYYTYTVSAEDAYYLEVTTSHADSNVDADLVVSYWDGSSWITVGDSGRSNSNERVLLGHPPAGDYRVEVAGYAIPGGTADVHLDITEVSGEGGMIFSGTPVTIELGVEYTLDLQFETTPDPGIWNGAVFLGPAGSSMAIEIPVTLYQGGAEKTASPSLIYLGDLVTFTIELEQNPGDRVGWVLEDAIPDGFEFVGVEGATYDVNTDAIHWHNAHQPWLDATTALTIAGGSKDDGYGALPMPFDFTFFGDTITATSELKLSTNGYATFGIDGTDYSNDGIPNATDPDNYLAPFWDDQEIDGGDPSQGMWYGVHGTLGDQVLALEWRIQDLGITRQPNGFQAQIHQNGDIWFLYGDMNEGSDGWGDSATIGLENSDGLTGTQYSYNSVSISDNWAIHFTPNVTGTYDIAYAGPLYEAFGNHVITLTVRGLTPGYFTNTVTINTGLGDCPISGTVTVKATNDAPIAANDVYTTDEDAVLTVNVAEGILANDSDPEDEPLTAVLDTDVAEGTLALSADGSFVYTPTLNGSSGVTFTYVVSDGTSYSNLAMVTIIVNNVNDAPVATDNDYTIAEDATASGNVLTDDTGDGVDSDADSNPLSVVLETGVTEGTLALNLDGSFIYTPTVDYNGVITFTYVATDGLTTSNVALVTITIEPVNDAPVADAGANQSVLAGVVVALDGSNSSDVDGDSLTYGWTQTGGEPVTLSDATAVAPTFTAPIAHIALTFTLVVTDEHSLASTPAEVVITVTAQRIYLPLVMKGVTAAARGITPAGGLACWRAR